MGLQQAGGKANVKGVKIRTTGTSNWIELENKWGGAFEYSHAPTYPLDVLIQGDDGPVRPPPLSLFPALPSPSWAIYMCVYN